MKPGWKTTEFWLTILAVIGANLQMYLRDGLTFEEVLAIAAAILAALGYTAGRSYTKAKNGK